MKVVRYSTGKFRFKMPTGFLIHKYREMEIMILKAYREGKVKS